MVELHRTEKEPKKETCCDIILSLGRRRSHRKNEDQNEAQDMALTEAPHDLHLCQTTSLEQGHAVENLFLAGHHLTTVSHTLRFT